ncbi:ketoacyl-ACP synthase III [Deltaproteobacteria bacterium TL4]
MIKFENHKDKKQMKLRDIAIAIPACRIDTKTIAEWTGTEASFITDKIGIESRAFLQQNEPPLSLSQQACDNLFFRNPLLIRRDIKLLVLVTQNPDYKIPHSSALLQNALKLSTDTACFDINLGCSGYVYALSVAKSFMLAEGIENGLVVTCDPYSKIMNKSDRDTITIFGDAATATWLSSESGGDIGRLDFGTDGDGAQHLMVKAGGSVSPNDSLWGVDQSSLPLADFRLSMNGRAIFNFMIQRVPHSVLNCLKKNRLSDEDVDYYVFHQASKFLLDSLRRKMDLSPDKVPCDLKNTGNTVSSSIPIILSNMMDQKSLIDKKVIISGFGVGLSWATNVINFGGKNDSRRSNSLYK